MDIDALFLGKFGREEMAFTMMVTDTVGAIIMTYIAISVSRSFGFGNFEQRLQMAHRIALLVISFFLGWHAEDIAVNPNVHGLTPINLFLHIAMVIGFTLSAFRLHRAVRNEDENMRRRKLGNGGAATGPFPLRN